MAVVETVKIVSENKSGYVVINKSDFTNRHELYKESEVETEVKAEVEEIKEKEIEIKTPSKKGKRGTK